MAKSGAQEDLGIPDGKSGDQANYANDENKDLEERQMGPEVKGQKNAMGALGTDKTQSRPDEPGYTMPNGMEYRGTELQPNRDKKGAATLASAISRVTQVTGEKVEGLNYGPSIGRFDNPPAVLRMTGTKQSIDAARKAVESRLPDIDTEFSERQCDESGDNRFYR